MSWLSLTIFSAFFASVANYLDKFLLTRVFNASVGALLLFSSFIGLLTTPILFYFNPEVLAVSSTTALMLILAGVLYMSGVFFYLQALSTDEVSLVSPLSLLSPMIGSFLGVFFLNEPVSLSLLAGGLFIFVGAVVLAVYQDGAKLQINSTVLLKMTLASLCVALNALLFKVVTVDETTFITSLFWEYVGFMIFGTVVWFGVKKYRQEFSEVFTTNSVYAVTANILNEVIILLHLVLFHLATLATSLAKAQWFTEAFQPIWIVLLGVALAVFAPKLFDEDTQSISLLKKVVAIASMIVGTFLIGQ